MLHPLFSLLARRPDLVMDHAAAYAALAHEEAAATGVELTRRALAWAVAVLCLAMFVVLAGVAAMLGAMQGHFHWMLLLVPGTALALAGVAFAQARQRLPQPAFAQLRSQFEADAQALRTLGSS
jgi:hypothetical protein